MGCPTGGSDRVCPVRAGHWNGGVRGIDDWRCCAHGRPNEYGERPAGQLQVVREQRDQLVLDAAGSPKAAAARLDDAHLPGAAKNLVHSLQVFTVGRGLQQEAAQVGFIRQRLKCDILKRHTQNWRARLRPGVQAGLEELADQLVAH